MTDAAKVCGTCGSDRPNELRPPCTLAPASGPLPAFHAPPKPDQPDDDLCECGHTTASHNAGDGLCACGCYLTHEGPQRDQPDAASELERRLRVALHCGKDGCYCHEPALFDLLQRIDGMVAAAKRDERAKVDRQWADAVMPMGVDISAPILKSVSAARKEAAK